MNIPVTRELILGVAWLVNAVGIKWIMYSNHVERKFRNLSLIMSCMGYPGFKDVKYKCFDPPISRDIDEALSKLLKLEERDKIPAYAEEYEELVGEDIGKVKVMTRWSETRTEIAVVIIRLLAGNPNLSPERIFRAVTLYVPWAWDTAIRSMLRHLARVGLIDRRYANVRVPLKIYVLKLVRDN